MSPTAARALALLLAVTALGGCGASSNAGGDEIAIKVTRDFGEVSLVTLPHEPVPPAGGLAPILRRYPNTRGSQSLFVNGILAGEPASELTVHGGDRVWLDHHVAVTAARIPAVVGAFPEPFLRGSDGKRLPVRVECDEPRAGPCAMVADTLVKLGSVAGRSVIGRSAADNTLRILVAPWDRLRGREFEADSIDEGPRSSGVYARFDDSARRLIVLDRAGRPARTLGAGTGLIAATREKDRQPVWFVTGTDAAGVAAAARAFEESVLVDRFAVAISRGLPVDVPLP